MEGRKILLLLLVLGISYKRTFSIPLNKLSETNNDVSTTNEEDESDEAESGKFFSISMISRRLFWNEA